MRLHGGGVVSNVDLGLNQLSGCLSVLKSLIAVSVESLCILCLAPCAPVIQAHTLDCASNHALVTWVEDKDAISVTVNATSSLGHSASCSSSTNSSCVLNYLQCGNTYGVQAFAQGVQCLSKPSSTFQIVTGKLLFRQFCQNTAQ